MPRRDQNSAAGWRSATFAVALLLLVLSSGCLSSSMLPLGGVTGGDGGALRPRGRTRRLVPRVTQRAPAFTSQDPQGGLTSEPTPSNDDIWWVILRGQF